MLSQILAKMLADNIQIPGGDNMSLWDLMFNPYENILGGFFWVAMIGLGAFLIWIKTESPGPPLIFFIVANASIGSLTGGDAAGLFWIFAVIGIVAIFFKGLVGRK